MDDDPTEADVNELAELIHRSVAGGDSLEAAMRRIGRFAAGDIVERARHDYERRVGRIRDLRDPTSLVAEHLRRGYWYAGPSDDDVYWPALQAQLSERGGLGEALNAIDGSSTKIVGLMRPPGSAEIRTRGLILGYVQSGKTTNFMSVIAKAADVGYRLFIVLSGITDNLRAQTQARVEEYLVGRNRERWFLLTSLDSDFTGPGNAANLLAPGSDRLLAVVKKNPYRLRRLLGWLDSAGQTVLQNCPILMVDDEADQASIDVGTRGRTSRINGRIKQILEKPKAAYVAYTATPFANLLIDPTLPEDLYPRDFVVELDRPDNYFGPERIFGRERLRPDEDDVDGLDLVRHVPPSEGTRLLPPRTRADIETWDAEVTESLEEAIRWFLLATAARRRRGVGIRHSTMLVHTSMSALAHFKVKAAIELYLRSVMAAWRGHSAQLEVALQAQWEREIERLPAECLGYGTVEWGEVARGLSDVLGDTTVIVDNYLSTERLSYPPDGPPVTAVVVGGNTLSRGLTLEGLVCSFFVRAASAYDTLLQMGRWFGYREGYGDLVRIWMTEELEGWFFQLATVEEEVRRDIRRYDDEGLTPLQVPVRIRTHPAMAITSAAKMRAAVAAKIDYSAHRQQTILFNHRDPQWLGENLKATRTFLRGLVSAGLRVEDLDGGRPAFKDVPAEEILRFLFEYHFHERAYETNSQLVCGYIQEQNNQGFLLRWSVVIMAHGDTSNGTVDLGLDERTSMMERARLDMPNIGHANIKALVSTVDRIVDLNLPREVQRELVNGHPDDASLMAYRDDVVGDVGLLCIYPISRDSQPRIAGVAGSGRRRRVPLEAADDVVGLGIFFPRARGLHQAYDYMSADLSRVEREPDDEDIDAIDEADEARGAAEPGGGDG